MTRLDLTKCRELARSPIRVGVFDSGVGGLAVARWIRALSPAAPMLYLADQCHAPYGRRPMAEVGAIVGGIVESMVGIGVEVVVMACNTASAAGLLEARRRHPGRCFVGMEPAVKPAAERSVKKRIGVIATPLTLQGELYAKVVERFAQGIEVLPLPCPEFVDLVEGGDVDSEHARRVVAEKLRPLLAAGIDQLALACTHFSFLKNIIEAECQPLGVGVIDPAEAVARQAARLIGQRSPAPAAAAASAPPPICLTTGGEPAKLAAAARQLLASTAIVDSCHWSAES